jgi:phosphoglycerate dehydrogenase-like enzyme
MNAASRAVMLITREMEADCFDPNDCARIASITDFARAASDTMDATYQRELMNGAEIIITGWGTAPISTKQLDVAPDLRLMVHSAGSIRHLVDAETFRARGIHVCSAAAAIAEGVAEFTLAMMLAAMKGVWQMQAAAAQGRWDRESAMPWVREPHGATIGIIGASLVGREVIRLCQAFRFGALLAYDPYLTPEDASELAVEKVGLDDLLRRADVVTLHTPATDETRHLMNAERFALMKDHAIFINTARGMGVDEAALIAELEAERLFACLDVTDPEPPISESPLYTLPNCILTPHISGAIKENRKRQGKLVADIVEAYVNGEPLPQEVNLTQLDRRA